MEQLAVKAIPQYHPLTIRVINLLETKKTGDIVSNTELAQLVGYDCASDEKGYRYVSSAMRYVLKSKRMVWQRVRGEGCIVLLNSEETIRTVDSHINRLRRESRKGAHKALTIDSNVLSEDKKKILSAQLAVCGTITMMTKGETFKKLADKGIEQPDTNRVLAWFPNK